MSDVKGVLSFADGMTPRDLVDYARRIEEIGYESIWLPDLFGREIFLTAGYVLANTERLQVATGIAHVYARDAVSAAQAARTLAELYPGRFIMGLGVSHPQAAEARGHEWIPPLPKMRAYLEGIAAAPVRSPEPAAPAPIYIAAHGPKLLALAAEHADGANTYLMPPEHTRQAREILGPDKRLSVVLPCCLCDEEELARQISRRGVAVYMELPAYRRQWVTWGFEESDFTGKGSDRLIDTVVAWGDESAIRERVAAHVEAGADQVVMIPYNSEPKTGIPWTLLETLAR